MNPQDITNFLVTWLVEFGLKIIGAAILWFVGRWLIGVLLRMMDRALTHRKVDPTLIRYLKSAGSIVLLFALVVAILAVFGIEPTIFLALFAAVGVAVGFAVSGQLANFAAGAFLVVMRPIKVGDFISAGGTSGTVEEIGLFVTTINTPDNVRTYVGNNKLFSDNIQNYSTNPYRRVDRVAQLHSSVDPIAAIALLKPRLGQIPNVLSEPAPDVEILDFNLAGSVLSVQSYCSNAHYWQVYYDTNRVIRETFNQAGYPAPESSYAIRTNGMGIAN